jgi:two-component system, chemotaxis family, sensor kinase CheA
VQRSEKQRNALEDLSARLLAADAADHDDVSNLYQQFTQVLNDSNLSDEYLDALRLGIPALERAAGETEADAPALLDAVASLLSSVVAAVADETEAEARSLADVAATLKRLTDVESEDEQSTPECAILWPGSDQITLPADIASDLMGEFVSESNERIAAAEAALLELEKNPDQAAHIDTVLRAFHTIKGAAGFLSLEPVQKLSHLAENLLTRARDGEIQITGRNADLAFRSCDALKAIMSALAESRPGGTIPLPDGHGALIAALAGEDVVAPAPEPVRPAEIESDSQSNEDDTAAEQSVPAVSPMSAESSVRVGVRRLDDLINMVGELVIAHSIVAEVVSGPMAGAGIVSGPTAGAGGSGDSRLTGSVAQSGKIIRELQAITLGLRMVPLKSTFHKMARLVRDVARKSGKTVEFVTSGDDTEIDRNMVEALSDPLVHLIRNAVDHGIEPGAERAKAGKPKRGFVTLRAYHAGGNVVIELSDDGRGLDKDAIRATAVERGLIDADREMTDAEISALVFHAGLSTAKTVSDVSGRGVGMDVVKKNIESLRGRVDVDSEPGRGTTFTLRVPLTMAITDAMLLRVGAERYLLPMIAIAHSFRPALGAVSTVGGKGMLVRHRDAWLPLFRLGELFDVPDAVTDPTQGLVLVVEGHSRQCAVLVDELMGQQQVVIKSLGKTFAHVPGISAGAVLGDGRVGLILDVAGLVELAHGSAEIVADVPCEESTDV